MAQVKWIKIATDIFDDEKILLIEALPEADTIITIWFKLLCLAGKQNNGGVFMMNDKLAYTEEMLATIFRRKVSSVTLALEVFEKYGMIERIEGAVTIPNWDKHQSLDAYENRKEYMKKYMVEYREKQKEKNNSKSKSLRKPNVNSLDRDRDKEEEIDKNKNLSKDRIGKERKRKEIEAEAQEPFSNPIQSYPDISCEDVQFILDSWNEMPFTATTCKSVEELMQKDKNLYHAICHALTKYTKEQIADSFANYSIIYSDEDFYFNTDYSLYGFLERPKGISNFIDGGLTIVEYKRKKQLKARKFKQQEEDLEYETD